MYQIIDWDKNFENDRSRQRDKCSFVCIPNKQDGMGLNKILSLNDGASILGIFLLIVESCSRQAKPRNGFLTDDGKNTGRAWTSGDMALLWRRKPSEIKRAIEVLVSDEVKWIKIIELSLSNRQVTADSPPSNPEEKRIEEKGREEKGMEGEGIAPIGAARSPDVSKPEKKKFMQHVYLTEDEYSRLQKELGREFLYACIFKLNSYLTNTPKKQMGQKGGYRDHNLVIRDWVIDEIKKKMMPRPEIESPPPPPQKPETPEERAEKEKAMQYFTEQTQKILKGKNIPRVTI